MRHSRGAHGDLEAAQGGVEHVQEVTGKMEGGKEKMLVMGKVFEHLAFHD